ncbi:MAG TPA: hypothetical protein VG845_06820 [Dehalococcoidia bacterium]|jgi:hypothetical protein|nr:hypothetical protein [Dehalococcoidia bacterium]
MKRLAFAAVAFCLAAPAVAQEHYTEGPVWSCSALRTKPNHFDDYMKYLRQNFVPQGQEQKKAGLILDQKFYVKVPESPTDPDVLICTLFPSFGKALDFNAADDAKGKEIAAKHFKTADEEKQREMIANRFAFRDALGTSYYREVTLKPLP